MTRPSAFRFHAGTLLLLLCLGAPTGAQTVATNSPAGSIIVVPSADALRRGARPQVVTTLVPTTETPQSGPAAANAALEEQERQTDKQHLRLIYQAIQAYKQKRGELPGWLSDLVPEFLADTNVLMSPVELRTGRSVLWGYGDPKARSSYIYEFNNANSGRLGDQDAPLTMRQWKLLQMEEFGPVIPILRCHLHDLVLNLSYSGDYYETGLFWESDTNTLALMAKLGPGAGARDASKVRLTVLDAVSGAVVPGAEVNASERQSEFGPLPPRQVTTDAKGQCEVNLGGKRPKGIRLQVTKAGYATAQVQWAEGAIPGQWSARLKQAVKIGGLVRDPAGQPIARARVGVNTVVRDEVGQSLEQELDVATTDDSGQWTTHSVPADFDSVTFKLTHPAFRPAEYYISGAGAARPQEGSKADLLAGKAVMVMEPGTTLAVTVTDPDGKPLANTDVFLRDSSDPPKDRLAATDASGQFKLVLTQQGQGVLAVAAKGYSPQTTNLAFESGLESLAFKLQPAKPLKGTVLGLDNKPVAGATVELASWNDLPFPKWRAQTDAKGRFTWDSAPSEGATLSVQADGYLAEQQSLAAGEEEVLVVLKPTSRIVGDVVDAETKEPIQEFQVIVGRMLGIGDSIEDVNWERSNPLRASGGKYSFSNQSPLFQRYAFFGADAANGPRVRLLVEAQGYLPQVSPSLSASGWVTNDFELKRGDGPRGVVRLPDGQPAAGVTVALALLGRGGYVQLKDGQLDSRGSGGVTAESDAAGKFALPAAYASRLLAASSQGYAEAPLERLDTNLDLTLQPWGRIEGVIRNGPRPATNQWVNVTPGQRTAGRGIQYDFDSYRARTDEQGRFVLTNVPPGERLLHRLYPLGSNRGWNFSHPQTITVKPAETTRIDFGGNGRTIIGKVVPNEQHDLNWQSGFHLLATIQPQPPPGGFRSREAVEAWQNSPEAKEARARYRSYFVQFADDGSFRIEAVPPGKYLLSLTFNEPGAVAALNGPVQASTRAFLGSVHQEVEVAPVPDGQPDQPLDLGRLDLVVQSQR